MPKVSIVVPVYNVVPYLKRCVDSIRNQSLSDIEIILVDDGSTDDCPALCDEYANLDNRIRVVHKQNGGLSSARNAGILEATGEYIGYVDSDDYVDTTMFEELYTCAVKYNVDFLMEDFWQEPGCVLNTKPIRAGYYTKEQIKQELYPILIMREEVNNGPVLSVCRCLYKMSFVKENKLFFDNDIKWSEDVLYSSLSTYMAQSFYYLKGKSGYHYCANQGSISKSFKPEAWEVYCLMNDRLHEFFDEKTDYNFSRQMKLHVLYFALNYFSQFRHSRYNFCKRYRTIKMVLNCKHFCCAMEDFEIPKVKARFKFRIFLMKNRAALLLCIMDSVSLLRRNRK